MDYKKFVGSVLGRFVDYDHAFGNQCVDLIRKWAQEIHGVSAYVSIPTTGSAKNIFTNFRDNKYFKKVLNTPSGIPKQGDIFFFKTSSWFPFLFGRDGHTGIVDSADINNVILLNQNYPTGSPCKFTKFSYKDAQGWLTKK